MVELLKQFATAREHLQQQARAHAAEGARECPSLSPPRGSPSPDVISFYRQAGSSPLQVKGAAASHQLQQRRGDQEPAGRSGRVGTLDQSQEGDQGLVTGGGGMADQGAVALPYTTGTRTRVSSRWAPSS